MSRALSHRCNNRIAQIRVGNVLIPVDDDVCDPEYMDKLKTAFENVRDPNNKLVAGRLEAGCVRFSEMCNDMLQDRFPVDLSTDDILQNFSD